MKKMLISLIIFLAFIQPAGADDIKIGVLAFRGELKALKRWGEFGNYLSVALNQSVKIVPLAPPVLTKAVAEKTVGFVLANPVQAAILLDKYGCIPLATLHMKNGSKFAGVIIAKKGNGITKSEDLKGKNVMSLSWKRAAGAYMFQAYHLYQEGIDPHSDFASFKEGRYQDDLVFGVQKGFIDAAFIRSGLLENMQAENKININDFVFVDRRDDPDFKLCHSTDYYPEWCFAARPDIDETLISRMKEAAMNLTPDSKAAKQAKIRGFVAPLSYEQMLKVLKTLNIPPYNKQ